MCISIDPFALLYVKLEAGLDNFDVGLSNMFPVKGSQVSANSYTLCGRYSGSVSPGQEITVHCAPSSQQFRYQHVIVRSSDATPERLCMAEVAVYRTYPSQYTKSRPYWCSMLHIIHFGEIRFILS